MPFDPDYSWQYENVALNKTENPDYTFTLPPYFVNAKEKYIVIRQVIVRFQRTTEPFDRAVSDIMVHSDLCDVVYLPYPDPTSITPRFNRRMGYICMANDPNMKKKRYKYVSYDNTIHFIFQTIDEQPIIPSRWLIDMLLVWRY
jgi:hypothetical protein